LEYFVITIFWPALRASLHDSGILSGGSRRSPPATLGAALRAFFIHLGIHHWQDVGPAGLLYIACLGNIGLPLAPFPCFPARRADIL